MNETRRVIDHAIQNDNNFKRLSSGLYFRSSHEAFGVFAELQFEISELSHRIDVSMNAYQRALRYNDVSETKRIYANIKALASATAEKSVMLAAAADKAFISICKISEPQKEV